MFRCKNNFLHIKFLQINSVSLTYLFCLFLASHTQATTTSLTNENATLLVSEDRIQIKKSGNTIIDLSALYFNYEKVGKWNINANNAQSITLRANMPASVSYHRTAYDNKLRSLEITISKVPGGFRIYASPKWGRQVSLEFAYLGDHFFGLTEALQPDNRLSPDLTRSSIVVDVLSEGASMRENYASAFSSFYMSTAGYGAFFDTFAQGRYDFDINKQNRIHHDTGTLDWYVFVGDSGSEIHKNYFSLIGKPKHVPLWGLGPIGWRDQNDGGAQEILSDIAKLSDMKIPFTAWFVDRPYSDGKHAWSKMNFSEKFAHPETWIKQIREDYGLEFMTWVSTATFGDPVFEKHFNGALSYIDLSHPPSVSAFQEKLTQNQYAFGVKGHKIDRSDEVFAEHEEWFDKTRLPERRNKYSWLTAKSVHDGITKVWQDQQLTFARSAIHRTQPYLSAIWGGDPRSTWDGLQGNFANAMRSSYMGFPVWGTDVGGYIGEGYIPEDLYTRWMQAGSMTGFFEIKLDGSGGDGRDRMPWRYNEKFQQRFRAICEDRMAFLPYLYSLASTSAVNGVLMKPMTYQHLGDENTWAIWDQFYLGDAILVAPVFTAATQRDIYLPKGLWRNFDKPSQIISGGKTISFEADLDTLPRFIKENSIFVRGNIYSGNSSLWSDKEKQLSIYANPASKQGSHTFTYVDVIDMQEKPITVTKNNEQITLSSSALSTPASVYVYIAKAPKAISLNGKPLKVAYNDEHTALVVPVAVNTAFKILVTL